MINLNNSAARIEKSLREARAQHGSVVLPYVTGGYPDLSAMKAILRGIDHAGAGCIEVGFAFSDSIADGPVIEESFFDVLGQGIGVEDVMEAVSSVSGEMRAPLVAMVSMSIIQRRGVVPFLACCAAAGFSGIIVPDLCFEQSEEIGAAARAAGIAHVLMVGPGTAAERGAAIAQCSQGFLYVVGARGTTGERAGVTDTVRGQVGDLRQGADCPICIGFGISERSHVVDVCSFSDGAIVGSALIRRLREWCCSGVDANGLANRAAQFVRSLATDDN